MTKILKHLLAIILVFGLIVVCNGQNKPNEKKKKEVNTQQTTKIKISVNGMSCMGCVANVKNTIEDLDGVQEVEVSLEKKEAIVTYVTSKVEPEKIQEAVNKKGFTAGKPEKQKQ